MPSQAVLITGCAGYSQSGAVESVPLEQVRRQFETNVFGGRRVPGAAALRRR